jgi:hypothetical protein
MNIGLHLKAFNAKLRYLNKNLGNLDNIDLEEEFEKLFRITLNSEFLHLHENNLIAITGLQGVGKSTLIKTIYKIPDNIIPTNLGVGEKIPVLITETNIELDFHKTYKKIIQNNEIVTEEIDTKTFLSQARSPHENILYLELKVKPVIFGNEHTQFLLLPGFESKKDLFFDMIDNSLYAATTCVFVTNKTKQAHGKNVEKLEEVFSDFENNKPVLVITSSDNYSDSDNRDFKDETLKKFKIEDEDRVICAGTYHDEEKNRIWMEEFKTSVIKYSRTKREFKKSQLRNLNELLRDDFKDCFKKIKLKIEGKEHKHGYEEYKSVSKVLEKYDDASKEIIKNFLENIRESLEKNSGQAKDKITKKIKEDGRFVEGIKSFFKSSIEKREEIKESVNNAWKTSNPDHSFTYAINRTLNEDTQLKLGRRLLSGNDKYFGDKENLLLGESQSDFQIDEDLMNNLKILTKKDSGEMHITNDKLEASIKIAPSLIVEYIRLNSIYPEFITSELKPKELKKENIGDSFREQHKYNKIILGGIGAILGVDSLDGEINSIQALLNATVSANTVAASFINPLSTIFITGSIIAASLQYLNKLQESKEVISHDLVDSIKENYLKEFKSLIENPIFKYREFLKEKLSQRLHLDKKLGDFHELEYSFAQADRELKEFHEEVKDSLSSL